MSPSLQTLAREIFLVDTAHIFHNNSGDSVEPSIKSVMCQPTYRDVYCWNICFSQERGENTTAEKGIVRHLNLLRTSRCCNPFICFDFNLSTDIKNSMRELSPLKRG